MDRDQINNLAEKIAEVFARSDPASLRSVTESIDRLSQRLDRIEASTVSRSIPNILSTSHPSLDRFAVAEAIADSLFDRDAKEKTCTFEPNDRPCDHCSMCSSRGF
ncbi:MAG: hypothetical protein ABIV21_02980 [Pyrinomonadaceae bacterium]